MRINVYGNDLRDRVESTTKTPPKTDVPYTGIQFFIGRDFAHGDEDDDTSAVVFWFHNEYERKLLRTALTEALKLVNAPATQR